MLKSLGDRYTRFLDPEQFRRMQEENSGQYGGVGISILLNAQEQPIIAQTDPTGPGRRAGLRIGDRVTEVAGHPIRPSRRAAERAQDLIHGNPGTAVTLAVLRKGRPTPIRLTLVRTLVYTPTVTYRMLSRGTGYLKLESFGERSDDEVGSALRRMKSQGKRALVFDMRGNPGGYFNSGIIIGQQTYGKALVQTISPIPDGSALLITTHHYYTPRGADISHKGVKPNIAMNSSPPKLTGADAPLQRAVAWLNDPLHSRVSARP
jgi:carboxyl-terminal processing protease